MSGFPRPHFFVTRVDGTKAPLIAVDELPRNVCIKGVPRTIDDAQTQGMMSLGLLPSNGHFYGIQEVQDSSTSSPSLAPPRLLENGAKSRPLVTRSKAPDAGLDTIAGPSLAQERSNDENNQNSTLVPYRGNGGNLSSWHQPGNRDSETQVN